MGNGANHCVIAGSHQQNDAQRLVNTGFENPGYCNIRAKATKNWAEPNERNSTCARKEGNILETQKTKPIFVRTLNRKDKYIAIT